MKAIYIHGFNSAASFGNEKITALEVAGYTVICPDLPGAPLEAIALLEQILQGEDDEITLVGTSLGGFYALHLASKHGLKCVLLNPAMTPYSTLAGQVGKQVNLRTGEEWEFTQQHIEDLKSLEVELGNPRVQTLLVVDEGDEVLDYKVAVRMLTMHASVIRFPGGNHRFTHIREVIPYIKRMQDRIYL